MARIWTLVIILQVLGAAALQVSYPLNLQLPPVAHINTAYQFQFAPTTFQSDSSKLQYSLNGGPPWLTLDSNTRTLSGTPRAGDAGEVPFTITAAGAAGAVANMPSKLLVSSVEGPKVKANLAQVLASSGQTSGPRTLAFGPSQQFGISFPMDTFDTNGDSVTYSALLSDRTPLPAWLSFDTSSLRFSGTTPPVASQSFDIILLVSKSPGYSDSSLTFTIAVSTHQLLFKPFSQNIKVDKGADVHITGLRSKLLLDGVPIRDGDLQSIHAKLPDWLVLDNNTFDITGKAPSDLMSQNLTVTAKDQFGDSANLNIYLSFSSQLFSRSLGNLNITVGEDLKLDIPRGILLNTDEVITFDFSSLTDSLHFDPSTFTITGKVAKGFPARNVECSMTATSKDGTLKDTQKFSILVSDAEGVAEKTSSTEQADNTEAIKTVKQPSKKEAGIVIGAVIGALCGICFLVAFALCLRQRKRRKSYISPKLPRSPRKSDISRPMFIPYGWPDVDTGGRHDLEDEKDEKNSPLLRSPENPPKLDLDLLDSRKDNESMTDSIGDADTRILDSFGESSWGFQNDIAPSQHPECSMKIATELAKRVSQKSENFRKHKRRTTTVYQDQIHRSNGLPVNRRITGMGHGRHTYSPSRSNRNISRPLLRRPRSTSSYTTTRCTSTLSTAPSALPQPPVARKHMTTVTNPAEARRSIRIVPASIRGSSWADRRTIDEKRNSYIRKRASAQSPFFSANGMRESSSSYKSPPAFLVETQSSPRPCDKSSEAKDTIVRPTDEVEVQAKLSLKAPQLQGSAATSPAGTPTRQFPGSLRQNRVQRPAMAHSRRDRVEKSYSRPELLHSSSIGMRRRASTRDSLRAYELKTSLNNLTGSEIFKDAELSDSVYTDEEEDIKEAERQTVKPGQYSLPPLNIDTKRHSKRKSADKPKRTSDGEGRWGLKRASERDPTPYYMASADEHGGKENQSSTYTLGSRVSPIRHEAKRKTIATSSPQRPKPTAIQPRPASDVRKTKRNSTKSTSQGPAPQDATKERHSRRSIHSRNQSRHSGTTKKHREHSRTQSTAYPYFDAASIDIKRSSIGNAITTAADAVCMPGTTSKHSLVTRDLSGNLTFYHASDEEPTIEELRSSSIGFRTSNGQVSTIARQSRLASLHESTQFLPQPPPKSAKRETAIHAPKPAAVDAAAKPMGLGLFPVDARAEMVAAERERTPLETVQGGNQEEKAGGGTAKGRQTWGSLKSIVGRSSRWVSQGYWEKQGKDDKVFI